MERKNKNSNNAEQDGAGADTVPDKIPEPKFEQLLIAIARDADRSAFERLFRSFAGRVYGLGMKMVNNDQFAKDLVQEVMLSVWQQAARYNPERGSAKSWMFAMSRNKCIDLIRRQKRHASNISADDIWPTELFDLALPEQASNDNSLALEQIDIQIITRLSHRLPQAQRMAIEMTYFEDLSHDEAATRLAIPLGTFKSRLRLGLIKLREMVEQKHA